MEGTIIPSHENPNPESLSDDIEPLVFGALVEQGFVVRRGNAFWSLNQHMVAHRRQQLTGLYGSMRSQ